MKRVSRAGWPFLVGAIGISACGGFAADSVSSGDDETGASEQALSSSRREARAAIDAARAKATFTEFETGQVRPLALSPNGKLLFAVNTPDSRLEIFRVRRRGLTHLRSVAVGLEPTAVAARSDREVWVVNHLSDSVSIVSLDDHDDRGNDVCDAQVVRTLLVGDEPRDIVFAGRNRDRAFITTAHRGQNTGVDPQFTTPGIGRADVWVFDANALGNGLGGTPVGIVNLFTDTPRALAVSPDGGTVYAAGFHTGNKTTTISERIVTNNGGLPPPATNVAGIPAPPNSLIVKQKIDSRDGQLHWLDELNRRWDDQVKFNLPDKDVFAIDAVANPPVVRSGAGSVFSGVGTVLFNMAVNPANGNVYVGNLDARNEIRFEGHNAFAGTSTVRGHIADNRITVLDRNGAHPQNINSHIDYSREGNPSEAAKSLAFPTDMVVSENGKSLYTCAFGSSKVAVFDTGALESGQPSRGAGSIEVTGGGPSGIVLDERRDALYVLTRFDNSISIIDTDSKREVGHVRMFNPEPASVVQGRRFLYDAKSTSSHGDSACASCHIFGDFDSLAWDLGDPDGTMVNIPGPFAFPIPPGFPPTVNTSLKGPMTTQSLRGMANHGSMHWRGDRTGGNDVPAGTSAQPDTGSFNEDAAFKKFNVAFPGLLGRAAELTDADMQAFTDFILQVTYPPNPVRNLDNSLTPDQAAGRAFYFDHATLPDGTTQEIPSDTFRNCNGCHVLDPSGNAEFGVAKPGFFGSDGKFSFESETQYMKVPHLRNAYQKVGMFGMANTFRLPMDASVPLLSFLPGPGLNDNSFLGDQVRGFGFIHDGSVDTLFRFFGSNVFVFRPPTDRFPNPGGITPDANGVRLRRQVEAFVLAFDSNLAPIVGQQVTVTRANRAAASARVQLMVDRATAGECDLVARGNDDGWLYVASLSRFANNDGLVTLDQLNRRSQPLTFTCAPPGSGVRLAFDTH